LCDVILIMLQAELSALHESGEEEPQSEAEPPAAGPGERGVLYCILYKIVYYVVGVASGGIKFV